MPTTLSHPAQLSFLLHQIFLHFKILSFGLKVRFEPLNVSSAVGFFKKKLFEGKITTMWIIPRTGLCDSQHANVGRSQPGQVTSGRAFGGRCDPDTLAQCPKRPLPWSWGSETEHIAIWLWSVAQGHFVFNETCPAGSEQDAEGMGGFYWKWTGSHEEASWGAGSSSVVILTPDSEMLDCCSVALFLWSSVIRLNFQLLSMVRQTNT